MKAKSSFDFWYAVNNTEIVMLPSKHLETFGATVLNYHMVSELMDSVNQVRVREGRMHANRPQIITPEAYSQTLLEGFGDEAQRYVDWLKEHEKELHILQYGYRLRQEAFSEHLVSDNMKNVVDRVQNEVKEKGDPFSAVLIGVDDPWDVCLIKLFWEVIQGSAKSNIHQLEQRHMFEDVGGVPRPLYNEIEAAFLAASRDSSLISVLGSKLQRHGLFEQYQDRFFALLKMSKK
jgi:hypothetical protein